MVRDWDLAEDLVQQAMAKLYVAWPRVREETRMAYARRTVVNECLSHLRRHRPETPTDTLPDHPVEAPDPGTDLAAALTVLPARQRAIVALRFLDDLPVSEVAAAPRHRRGHRQEPDLACAGDPAPPPARPRHASPTRTSEER